MSNGPVIGKMSKGTPSAQPAREAREAGVPQKETLAGPPPRGQQHDREGNKTVGRNSGRVR